MNAYYILDMTKATELYGSERDQNEDQNGLYIPGIYSLVTFISIMLFFFDSTSQVGKSSASDTLIFPDLQICLSLT